MRKYNLFVTCVGIVVFVLLTVGFSVVGTPDVQRGRNKDASTLSNFQSISYEVDNYYRINSVLPNDLNSLGNVQHLHVVDSESSQPYGYRIRDERSYELCAEFSTEVLVPDSANRYDGMSPNQKMHKKGYDCISFSIPDFLLNKVRIPTNYPSNNNVSPADTNDDQVVAISPSPTFPKNDQDDKVKTTFSNQWMFSFEYPSDWLLESESNVVYLYSPTPSNLDAGRFGSYPRLDVSATFFTNLELETWFNDQYGSDLSLPRTGNAPTLRKTFINAHGVKLLEVDAFTDMGPTRYYFKSRDKIIVLTPFYKQEENGGVLNYQVYEDIIDSITLM